MPQMDPRFPELTHRQISILQPYGEIEKYNDDAFVFSRGQLQYDFFVVLDGGISVEDPQNNNKLIVLHGKNEFSGDSSMLSNRAAELNGIAQAGSSLLRIKP